MIPPINRTARGIRNYSEENLGWVDLAVCMRGADLSLEAIIEYLKLYQTGNFTLRQDEIVNI